MGTRKTMFTKEEAVEFVGNILEVTNPLKCFEENKLRLLNKTIKSFHDKVPFHNITLLCLDEGERRVPTCDEIKRDMLSTVGGLCVSNNTAFKFLLEALGYDIHFASGTVHLAGVTPHHEGNHMLSVVNNVVKEGDTFLVDVGCGFPTYEAIPLDFDVESPVYRQSFLQFKFVKKGDTVERYHLRHCQDKLIAHDHDTNEWDCFYHFSSTPVEFDDYRSAVSKVYTPSPRRSSFHRSLSLVCFKKGKCTAFKDDSLLEEGDDNRLHKRKCESIDEMKNIVVKLCPQIPVDQITKALKAWEIENKQNIK